MTKEVIISLPVPYAIYDVRYCVSTLRELDETKALIMLAIVSNKKTRPTDSLREILHNFYHLNNNYDDLFAEDLKILIENKTITNDNDELPSLNSLIGNFNVDEKVQKLLSSDDGKFVGNSEDKHNSSLNLKKGLFIDQTYREYNQNDKNLIPFGNELVCNEFVDLNLNINNKYDNGINEYINNNHINSNENLFSHEYRNLSDIQNGTNLVYFNTDCKFSISINEQNANIFCNTKLEQKIYDDYYVPKIFYQDLLQLICNKISCKLTNTPAIDRLNNALEFIEDESIINLNKCFNTDSNAFTIINNQLWQLFIYYQDVVDEVNNHATWTKLYGKALNNQEIKEIITNNLADDIELIKWIYSQTKDSEIKNFILQIICQDAVSINKYETTIDANFNQCIPFLIKNQIDLELIIDLFPKQINAYLNEEISNNKEEFLKLLKERPISNPYLQKIIISKLNNNYEANPSCLVNHKLEQQIIDLIKQTNQLIDNSYQLNDDKLDDLYYQLNKQIDIVKQVNRDYGLSCLKELTDKLSSKRDETKIKLADVNFAYLTKCAHDNRQILEIEIPNLLQITYDQAKGVSQIYENTIIEKVLSKQEFKQFRDFQKYNSGFLHGSKDKDSYSDKTKSNVALNQLRQYNQFLLNLENKIKKFKEENKKKEDK